MFKPNADRMFVFKAEAKEKSEGGILLPGGGANFKTGIVECVGPDVEGFKRGDKVAFKEYTEFKGEGYDGFIVHEEAVLGKFEDE